MFTVTAVTLHVRVWIEICCMERNALAACVTLHVRVWIEISNGSSTMAKVEVTLHVRVWIEIPHGKHNTRTSFSHPPREGVD